MIPFYDTVSEESAACENGRVSGGAHHRAHQFGGVRQLRLGGPQFIRDPVKAVHRSIRFCTQRGIVRKLPLPEELQRGGHLLDVVDLGPSLIGRAFSLPKPLLNVHDQAHAPGRWGGILRSRDRTLPGDDRPDVLGIVTVPEGGCPEPGRFLLSRHKKGDRVAPSPPDRIACLLHEPQEVGKIGGALLQGLLQWQP